MTVRSGMAYLIREVRDLIDDTQEGVRLFSDQTIQNVLDEDHREYRQMRLIELPDIEPGTGATRSKTFAAPRDRGWWEEDDGTNTRLHIQRTSDWQTMPVEGITLTSDGRAGRWTFSDHINERLVLTGFRYPVYNAAITLLKRKLARLHEQFDVMSPRTGTQQRTQIQSNIRALISDYQQLCEPEVAELVRGDAAW